VAPDPATLPPDELDLPTLWRHPKLLFAQCCWGPIETTGLDEFVTVVGQSDYSGVEGGEGQFYRSALLMRRRDVPKDAVLAEQAAHSAPDGHAAVPADLLRGRRFAFNSEESMSGILALTRDLEVEGESLAIFSGRIETGGHRASIRAVADGRADVCAIDCRSWAMAKRYEPAALALDVVGWTKRRRGLPFVSASGLGHVHDRIRDTLAGMRDGA
jgi:ABC-type phosphate/phosphonate transport system substrate-binding protein